jgi:diguanylate cyclase (GGDEF)-like protein
MELTLWRWSIGVQISSLALIGAFFFVLRRSIPGEPITWWARGWVFNFLALAAALFFWMIRTTPATQPLAFFLFMAPKSLAVLCLAQGAWSLHRPSVRPAGRIPLLLGGLVFPLLGAWAFTDIDRLGVGQQLFIGLVFLPTGIALIRAGDRALGWLGAAFVIRGGLCTIEAAAYLARMAPDHFLYASLREPISTFLSIHSSIDSGAEWLLALGFVLALSLRGQRELQSTISELHAAQDGLRRLVDHDPLTALSNRRALPAVLRSAQPDGATLLFFDLDDFKRINDEQGHEMGDRSLQRFADALRESFRPNDAFIRFGGDEFLVVAPGLDRERAEPRVTALRKRLSVPDGDRPALRFSVGIAELGAGGRPEDALRAADGLMYEAKANRAAHFH